MKSDNNTNDCFPNLSELYLWNMLPDRESRTCFHMPGHLSGRFFAPDYYRSLVMTDTTELSCTDDLHDPSGPVIRAADVASQCFDSGKTYFVSTGSSTGIRVMIGSVMDDKTFFLFPRTVHVSVLYTAALLDLPFAFILPDESESPYLLPVTTPESVESSIQANPDATDVLIVSPDYYGRCADIEAISKVVRQYGLRLLVDEAHGSHLPFCPHGGPPTAMKAGADMSVMSLHKTLPAMTMASMLHVSREALVSGRVEPERVYEMLRTFETSSPSFLIAASSEYAIAWARKSRDSSFESTIQNISAFHRQLAAVPGIRPLAGSGALSDPFRVVLFVCHPEITARQIHDQLTKKGIDIEFSDLRRLVLLVSPGQPPEDFDRLIAALSRAISDLESNRSSDQQGRLDSLEHLWRRTFCMSPGQSLITREALFHGKRKLVSLENAEGEVAAVPISPYPPGIPVLWPGEMITNDHVRLLMGLLRNGITVSGLREGAVLVRE